MRIFYTADNHFGHHNIMNYCDRPFTNTDDMDATMIERWNMKVTPKDRVYILGDFAFKREIFLNIIPQLSGELYFIPGNHDIRVQRGLRTHTFDNRRVCFLSNDIVSINDGKMNIVLCHYPMYSWNRAFHGSYHFFGHEHGVLRQYHKRAFDVGVDCFNFEPVTFGEIIGSRNV